jgi:hypothetical protein
MREINDLHRFIRIYQASCGRSLAEAAGYGPYMASFFAHFWLPFPLNQLCCGQLRNFKDGFVLQKRLSPPRLGCPDTADLHRPHRRTRFPVFPSSRFHSWRSLIRLAAPKLPNVGG